jgi:hypothetical protein
MSQTALRRTKKSEEVYCELVGDSGFNIAWGVGSTEREAADQAESRWRRDFKNTFPSKKNVVIRNVRSQTPSATEKTP